MLFWKSERGSISLLAGLFLSAMMGAAGFAIDITTLFLEKDKAQSAADLAAIAAAADMPRAEEAAAATVSANGVKNVKSIVVTLGRYVPDAAIAASLRFEPGVLPYNAAKVRIESTGTQFFSKLFQREAPMIGVTGVAATSGEAIFSLGSRLAGFNGGVPNRVLSALLGGNVLLSSNDYQSLGNGDLTIADFITALAAANGATSGTYADVLSAATTVGDVLDAVATVTANNGDSSASTAAALIKSQSSAASLSMPMSTFIDLGSAGTLQLGETSPGLNATFNALELINAAAATAKGGKPVPIDLNGTVPGVLALKLQVITGVRTAISPWVKVGDPAATLYATAARIRLTVEVGGSGVLKNTTIKLPIYAQLADARGRLDSVSCPGGFQDAAAATIGTLPGAAKLWIGTVTDAGFANMSAPPAVTDATLVDTFLIKVFGRAYIDLGGMTETALSFELEDVKNQTVKTAGASGTARSVFASLLGKLQMTVNIFGLSLETPASIMSIVANALGAVAGPVDAALLSALDTLGIHIGQADVRVHGIRCDGGVLVN